MSENKILDLLFLWHGNLSMLKHRFISSLLCTVSRPRCSLFLMTLCPEIFLLKLRPSWNREVTIFPWRLNVICAECWRVEFLCQLVTVMVVRAGFPWSCVSRWDEILVAGYLVSTSSPHLLHLCQINTCSLQRALRESEGWLTFHELQTAQLPHWLFRSHD